MCKVNHNRRIRWKIRSGLGIEVSLRFILRTIKRNASYPVGKAARSIVSISTITGKEDGTLFSHLGCMIVLLDWLGYLPKRKAKIESWQAKSYKLDKPEIGVDFAEVKIARLSMPGRKRGDLNELRDMYVVLKSWH